ncbi:MAG TPA: IS30 family transposase [Acidimicrobiia bacterium]|nr:IS30 family transposase [Acidimicrobiia bacterium]
MARLTVEQRRIARRMHSDGYSLREIGAEIGCSHEAVRLVLRAEPIYRVPREWVPGPGRLTLGHREEISLGLQRGETFTAIAGRLGRSVSTVSREVGANGGRGGYRAWRAHRRACERAKRPKVPKLACRRLAGQVEAWLQEWWSPEEISRRLLIEFPDDPGMRVSHETIYRSLFVQGRGELRRELTRCLRTGRVRRQPQSRNRFQLGDMVMISERPPEVRDRAVPGHWEGDLILGKDGHSAVGTLVERTTRYVLLLHLPQDRTAAEVDAAMRRAITKLPGELFRTITWDQGCEMARHATFTIDTGIQVYFCDPRSPWQRGSNENTNGLLRQYMPKGIDLRQFSQKDLDRFARSLNNRPRKTLGFMKPSERLSELLAHTG